MSRLVAACLLLSIWALTGSAGESDATVVMQRADGSKQCEPKPDSRAVSKMVSRAKAELKNSQVRALELKRLESGKNADPTLRFSLGSGHSNCSAKDRRRACPSPRLSAHRKVGKFRSDTV